MDITVFKFFCIRHVVWGEFDSNCDYSTVYFDHVHECLRPIVHVSVPAVIAMPDASLSEADDKFCLEFGLLAVFQLAGVLPVWLAVLQFGFSRPPRLALTGREANRDERSRKTDL